MFNAFPSTEYPSNLQLRIDYGARTDGQPDYMGHAKKGLLSNQDGWQISKLTYTEISGTDYVSLIQIGTGAWDDRASISYS
jgi:hypothetical protein